LKYLEKWMKKDDEHVSHQKAKRASQGLFQANGAPIPSEKFVLSLQSKYGAKYLIPHTTHLDILMNGRMEQLSYQDANFEKCLFTARKHWDTLNAP